MVAAANAADDPALLVNCSRSGRARADERALVAATATGAAKPTVAGAAAAAAKDNSRARRSDRRQSQTRTRTRNRTQTRSHRLADNNFNNCRPSGAEITTLLTRQPNCSAAAAIHWRAERISARAFQLESFMLSFESRANKQPRVLEWLYCKVQRAPLSSGVFTWRCCSAAASPAAAECVKPLH